MVVKSFFSMRGMSQVAGPDSRGEEQVRGKQDKVVNDTTVTVQSGTAFEILVFCMEAGR